MEHTLDEDGRGLTVGAKVSRAEKDQMEDARKVLGLRSIGQVIRLSFSLMQQTMAMQKMAPQTMDEQKALFAALNKFVEEAPEDLTPEAMLREVVRKGEEYIDDHPDPS